MADHDLCDFCRDPDNGIQSSPALSRADAFALYMQLQKRGYCPSMCENQQGQCRVCHGGKPEGE